MPSAPVKPYVPEGRVGRRLPFDLWVPVAAVVALVAVALLASGLRTGPYVSSIAFQNPSKYSLEVSVAGGSNGSTTLLGNIAAEGDTTVQSVFDQGSTWTFRFSTQDRYVGEIVMSRADLVRAGWHVDLDARLYSPLERAGVPPTN